ncbi:MAG: aminotransferase class IV [Proteobacteria bacterium]|nr:aminotransferase class IV [Pseudomonadota bacterium]
MDAVPLDDRGLTLGDGLFETILAHGGMLVAVDAHLRRMVAGCEVLGLPAPDVRQADRLCREALERAGLAGARAAVRLTLTAGSGGRGLDRPAQPRPRLFATSASAPAPVQPARLIVAGTRRNETSPASRLKTLSYLDNVLARREAAAAGADEAVMLNSRGDVACAGAANLFWRTGERLFTPALACGVLDGIVRGAILAAAPAAGLAIEEVAAPASSLEAADEIVLTNSLIGARPVSALNGIGLSPRGLAERLAGLAAGVL